MLNYDNVLICELGNGSTPFTDIDALQTLLEDFGFLTMHESKYTI